MVKITERIMDSTTGLKMKSGEIVEIHIIRHDNGEKSLVIEKDDRRLVLQHEDISDFISFLNDFINNV
jgi:hypothetical protein